MLVGIICLLDSARLVEHYWGFKDPLVIIQVSYSTNESSIQLNITGDLKVLIIYIYIISVYIYILQTQTQIVDIYIYVYIYVYIYMYIYI